MLDVVRPATHVHRVRVYYEDTDAGGIVYYANYLKYAERGRTEFLRELCGDDYARMLESGMGFVVRRCSVDYDRPARLDDLLEVHSQIVELGAASLSAKQVVRREDNELVRMLVDLACVDRGGRPARIPPPLRQALEDFRANVG